MGLICAHGMGTIHSFLNKGDLFELLIRSMTPVAASPGVLSTTFKIKWPLRTYLTLGYSLFLETAQLHLR